MAKSAVFFFEEGVVVQVCFLPIPGDHSILPRMEQWFSAPFLYRCSIAGFGDGISFGGWHWWMHESRCPFLPSQSKNPFSNTVMQPLIEALFSSAVAQESF